MEHFWDFNIGQVGQVLALAVVIAMLFQSLKDSIKNHAFRLTTVEGKLDGITALMIGQKSHEEQIRALDARMLEQGKRIDSQATIISSQANSITGRLEAINNIVSGHTAQLNNLPRKSA